MVTDINSLFETIVTGVVAIVFSAIATIFIVYSGVMFLTAAGDTEKLRKARSALMWGVVGVAVGAAAYSAITIVSGLIGGGNTDIKTIAKNIVNLVNLFGGAVSVIMIVWVGVLFLLAKGEEKKVAEARMALLWGIVGVAVIFGAGALINWASGLLL